MKEHELKILVSREEIAKAINSLAKKIDSDYLGKKILLVGVLKGAAFFLVDLARSISLPLEIDFVEVSSYGNKAESSGKIKLIKDIRKDLSDYHVLIVEDILDSGLTLQYLIDFFKQKKPLSVKSVVLFYKMKNNDCKRPNADYFGLKIPDYFVVGYGLDYAEKYRNLKDLYVVSFV
ncbi:hypoxanthine phosphoribosyltransferase [Thermodesulfobium narugense DSM 14796]|uniref:Hypoxanthine phosphoribosyltransferase n=1 Tax=Thermodesulfobium narugense DSM 14796 TaxID=747365 RepID=M1E5N1_9BACT|nr:hypoxanthine phosphoribosyltransferase [Thermodesulfobium narugense]AEE14366.1 hypoxanthine phosphoribosyltransferase [Thermodesulfobium narugense DSM 14796]